MGANTFGEIFSFTTFGESHGKSVGVVIDGCPAGLHISESEINHALSQRAPGKTPFTSPRKETDQGQILSGVFKGETTGAPIAFIVENKDQDPSKYEAIKDKFRPGHAHYTYLKKYGVYDYRGGGRASARETIGRVVAGCIAKKALLSMDIFTQAYLKQVGDIELLGQIFKREDVLSSAIFCPDKKVESQMISKILKVKEAGDSIGGVVAFETSKLPLGLGDPVYGKIEAVLASAMMSIPASKGFDIGRGFESSKMKGSQNNDPFILSDGSVTQEKNDAGGVLGGISSGDPVFGRVAFKPTSSIMIPQNTVDEKMVSCLFQLPKGSRHDPCVAIRAVPIVDAMLCCVLFDLVLKDRTRKL